MGKAIQVSTDNGLSWNFVYQYTDPDYSLSLMAFNVNEPNIYISGAESYHFSYRSWLKVSTNNGVDWTTDTIPNSDIHEIIADDSYMLTVFNWSIYRLENNDNAWTNLVSYFQAMSINKFAKSGNNIYMTATFVRVPGGLFKSTDDGASWANMSIGSGYPMDAGAIAVSGAKIAVGAAHYLGGENGVYLSTDNGASWTPPGLSNITIKCLAFTASYVFAGTGNGIFRSSDNGINWIQLNAGLTDTSINAINVKDNNLFIAVKNSVYLSTNNGDSWITSNNGLSNVLVNCMINAGSDIFAGSDNGVFLSTDNGTNWISGGMAGLIINALAVYQTDIYAATNNVGVCKKPLLNFGLPVELTSFTATISNHNINLSWQTATELNNRGFNVELSINKSDWTIISFIKGHGTTTSETAYSYIDKSVKPTGKYFYRLKQLDNNGTYKYSNIVELNLNLPAVYALNQNYPNPFNPNTLITYSLPLSSNIKLIIYNTLGQSIKTLETGYKLAGNYSVNFNASNLPSGIYFYKLEAGSFSQIKKMILLK
jgi:hypothetical protein